MVKAMVMLKPDAIDRRIESYVLSAVAYYAHSVEELRTVTLTGYMLDRHYVEHIDKDFYPTMRKALTGKTARVMIVDVVSIEGLRGVVFDIREELCRDEDPKHENLVHASDSVDAANREIDLWFGHQSDTVTLTDIISSDEFLRAVGSY